MTFNMNPYKLVNLKVFRAMEGEGFNVDITFKGKKIGSACNGGEGGPTHLNLKEGQAALEAYAQSLPNLPARPELGLEDEISMDAELFIDLMVEELQVARLRETNRRKFEKLCLTQVLYRRPTDAVGGWRSSKMPRKMFDEAVAKRGDIVTVLNDQMASNPYAWEN